MRRVPKPDRTVPFLDMSGNISQGWDDFLAYLDRRGVLDLSDVTGSPANGEVLIYNGTTKKFEPGAN